jgi:protein phosphatase 1 regulatory subunit 7
MGSVQQDGFNFLKYPDGRLFLSVESDRLQDCLSYCQRKQVRFLHISEFHGFHLGDVSFLNECPKVLGIHLQGYRFTDLSGLYHLKHLTFLSAVIDLPQELDLSRFPELEELYADWHPRRMVGLYACPKLKRLWLRKYKPQSRRLAEIGTAPALEALQLIQSPIVSLDGIESLYRLREFVAHYCSRLKDIGPITARSDTLERLRLDNCKNIEHHDCVVKLKKTKYLAFCHDGPIPSIGFVRQMPQLEFFAFVGTDVVDGDMTPLFGLSYAGFTNKRHFTHTMEEVDRIICERIPPPDPVVRTTPWSW